LIQSLGITHAHHLEDEAQSPEMNGATHGLVEFEVNPGVGISGPSNYDTAQLLGLQYDAQPLGFSKLASSSVHTVAGAYQSVTGNLSFR